MTTGLSLENLAQILHADKQRQFAEEGFARQVELAQNPTAGSASRGCSWRERLASLVTRQLVVTVAIRPLRLPGQWLGR